MLNNALFSFKRLNDMAFCDKYFLTHYRSFQKVSDCHKLGASEQLIRNANLQHRLAQARQSAMKQFEVRGNSQTVFSAKVHNFLFF